MKLMTVTMSAAFTTPSLFASAASMLKISDCMPIMYSSNSLNTWGQNVVHYFAICLVISNNILNLQLLIIKCTIMARQLKKESATGIHHSMLRGINCQDIFVDSEDYCVFIYYLHKLIT